ncbi:MAG: hypothetical protein ABI895_24485 [Deltaproteobacteria bacterium]
MGAATVLGTLGAGCSLLYDLSTDQCAESTDCARFGAGYTCSANVCQAPTDVVGGAGTGGSAGSGGSQTGGSAGMDQAGSSGSAGAGVTPGCSNNGQCIDENGDQPFVCRAGECIDLRTDACPFVIGKENLRVKNPIIIGAYTYIDPQNVTNSPSTANYELALQEFTANAGEGLGDGRRIAIVACDAINAGTFAASLNHLIDDVHVPGIIAPLFSNDLATLFTAKGHDGNVFFLSPLDADSTLTRLPDDGLIWNILGSAAQLAPSYVPLLERTEAYIHTRQTTQAPIKVALVDDETVYAKDISEELTGTTTPLSFNGQLAGAQLDDGCGPSLDEPCFLPLTIPSRGVAGDYTATIEALDAFQPDVIIALNGAESISNVVEPLEAVWDEARPARPFYLMSPYQAGSGELHDAVVSSTQQNKQCNSLPCPTMAGRLLGINFESARNPSIVTSYRTRFHQYTTLADFYENFYDAAWYMFYAIAAAGDVPLTGTEIARGMGRLVRTDITRTFAVGPAAVSDVLYALGISGTGGIQLDGAMGPPDFDPGTGARRTLGSAYCVSGGGNFLWDVMRYEASPAPPSMSAPGPSTCVPAGF